MTTPTPTYDFGTLVTLALSGRAATPMGRLIELGVILHDEHHGPVRPDQPAWKLIWTVEQIAIPRLNVWPRWSRHSDRSSGQICRPGAGRIAALGMAVAHVVAPDLEQGDTSPHEYLNRVFFGAHRRHAPPGRAMNWDDNPRTLRRVLHLPPPASRRPTP